MGGRRNAMLGMLNFKSKSAVQAAGLALAVVITALLFFTPLLGNVWSVTTGRGFIIPKESSIFAFRVTEMNSGSGEWWLYGEDAHHFYAQGDRTGVIYIAFPKSMVASCPSFRPLDWTTWCQDFQTAHHSP